MPFYVFECKKCKIQFEEICTFSDHDAGFPNVKCSECNSKSVKKILADSGMIIPHGTYGYRVGKNMEKAKMERAYAESKTKVKNPYKKIDDTNNGRRMNFID